MLDDVSVVIDSDAHVFEPDDLWATRMQEKLKERGPRMAGPGQRTMFIDGVEMPPPGFFPAGGSEPPLTDERFRDAAQQGFDPGSHLGAFDRERIDLAVVLPTRGLGVMGVVGVGREVTTDAARAYNDWLQEWCAGGNGRLLGVGMVDPRDPKAASEEAKRCADLGFVGVFLRPNMIDGHEFSSSRYDGLWTACEANDLAVCFHEGGVVRLPQIGPDRFPTSHAKWHTCQHPIEQMITMADIVLGGVLERYPTLRMAFLECGCGWLPYWMWRMDEHVEGQRGGGTELSLQPSEYVRRQCFVSVDIEEWPAVYTLEVLNGGNVVWGSDYPHGDSNYPEAMATLLGTPGLSQYVEHILFANPRQLYGKRMVEASDKCSR